MAADYTSSKYSATSATLWACRCCVSVCVWMFALCVSVCVCHLVWAFYYDTCVVCWLCALFVACTHLHPHTHTHTQRNTPVDRLTNMLALQRLSKLWQEQMNMEITSVIQFDSHCAHAHTACGIWMCAKASLKLLLLTDKGLGTAAAQI